MNPGLFIEPLIVTMTRKMIRIFKEGDLRSYGWYEKSRRSGENAV